MISGDDGGATVSVDGGKRWSPQDNQPTAQFYHVVTDNRFPYFVYGAQQDNSDGGDRQPQRAAGASINRTTGIRWAAANPGTLRPIRAGSADRLRGQL